MEISFFQHRMEISFFSNQWKLYKTSPQSFGARPWRPQQVAGSAVLAGGLPRSAQQLHYINGMGHRCESGESLPAYRAMGYNNGK